MHPRLGSPAPPVRGVGPDGFPAEVSVDRTVALLFLTSSCKPCQAYWGQFTSRAPIALITPDPATEDRRRVAKLAAGSPHPVVLSSETWLAYGVSKAPWLVVIDHGTVVADEPAPDQLADALVLLDRALD